MEPAPRPLVRRREAAERHALRRGRPFRREAAPQVNRLLSLRGQTLVAPLADAHNHNLQSAWGLDKFGQDYLRDGVFYAAMLCADPAAIEPIRARISQPEAPDVLFATACITSSDGQPLAMLQSGTPPMALDQIVDKAVLVMDTPEQVGQKWPLIAGRHSDLVKVIMSYHDRPEPAPGARATRPPGRDARGRGGGGPPRACGAAAASWSTSRAPPILAAAVRAGADFIAELPGYFPQHGEDPETHLIAPDVAAPGRGEEDRHHHRDRGDTAVPAGAGACSRASRPCRSRTWNGSRRPVPSCSWVRTCSPATR